MMQSKNWAVLEYFGANARINKKLLNCLLELTRNLIKVRNAKIYKVDDNTEIIITQENEHNFVEHNIGEDDLSQNITILYDHTLELERICQQKHDHSIIEYQSTDEFMAGPFKALMLQNLTETSVQLTEQISHLIHMYKSDEVVSGHSKRIRKCLSKINQNIKSIPQIEFNSLNDTIASQTLNNFSTLNANLSENLKVLIKKVAKLKKVYNKKSRNLELVVNNHKNLDNFGQENVQEKLMKTDESILDTDDTSENDPRNGTNTVADKIQKRKINMIDTENHVTKKKSKLENTIIKVEPNVEREIFAKQPKSKKMTLKLAENGTSNRITANIELNLMELIEMQKAEKIKKERESTEESDEMITEYNTDDSIENVSNYVSTIYGNDEEDEDNEQMYEDIINNQTIHDNEQFMEIQDRVQLAKDSRTGVSKNIQKKLSHLCVLIQWKIPQAHIIEKKLTRGPDADELAQLKALNVKWGHYSNREHDTIRQNWAAFCIEHDFDPADPSPFLLLQQKWNRKKLFKYTERKKFVQYLGKGLPHRALSSIYRKFRVLFRSTKSGRFTPAEDKIILMHAGTNSRMKFSELEELLKRCRASIEVRYRLLKNLPNETVRWDLPKQELLLKTLLKEMGKQTVEELRNADITNKILANVAKEMQLLVIKVIHHWKNKLYCQLFAEKPIRTNIIKVKLIYSLRKLGVEENRDIDWKQIAKNFPGLSQFFLYLQLRSIIAYNVPQELREDLTDTLEYLHKYWIPVVRARKDYRTKCCKRLELDMNGHLVVKNDDT